MPKVTDRFGRPVSGQMPGIVEAIVVDNAPTDGDKKGCVKVKFPLLPEAPESFWARLVMPMAGKNRGWMTIPEKDDEVIVAFMHGDFNNAIVLGSVYNGVDTPPYANEDGDNNLRVFQSRSGHRLTFDDTDGAERIELILHNEEIKIIWDSTEKTIAVYSGKDIIIEAKDKIDLKCTDFIVEASNSVNVKAGGNMKMEAGGNMNQEASGNFTVKGAMVKIN